MRLRLCRNHLLVAVAGLTAALSGLAGSARSAEESKTQIEAKKPKRPQFLRILRDDEDRPAMLQTAVKRYVPSDSSQPGLQVDLIAAVHVGDRGYYEQLNREFEEYDALLYELIAPEGVRPSKSRGKNRGVVSGIQTMMKDVLALEFQLEQIDYRRENFVHADMSPEQFSESMRKRNESPLKLFLRMMRAGSSQKRERPPQQVSSIQLLAALFDRRNGPMFLKRIVADELSQTDTFLEALNGDNGSTIITERNRVAMDVLGAQLEAGQKRFGIFYGAGHMPDLEERLLKRYGLKLAETRWLNAWKLSSPAKSKNKNGDAAKNR